MGRKPIDKNQLTLEEIEQGMSVEDKLRKQIIQLEFELKDAKEIKGLLFAILQKLK